MIREPAVTALSASHIRKFGLAWWCVSALAVSGCGNAMYAVSATTASSKLAEARELGAEQYAPYEYTMAREHLDKARTEAAEADYGDATELSDLAEQEETPDNLMPSPSRQGSRCHRTSVDSSSG